jgi:DNA-binding GntR family transcriptional regulator
MESVPRSSETSDPIRVDSVADLAYERIRAYVLGGEVPPGARLGQVELAERFGISRTPVREALRRLTGEGLVDFHSNRGFRVVDLGLDAVLRRMEVRSLVEPGIARLAAERRTEKDLQHLEEAIANQEGAAGDGTSAHDASRDFHMALARASGNDELARVLGSLWLVEVGRRLLSRRTADPNWLHDDVSEHSEILTAVGEGRAADAERFMAEHIGRAVHHWEPLGAGGTRDG